MGEYENEIWNELIDICKELKTANKLKAIEIKQFWNEEDKQFIENIANKESYKKEMK